MILVSEGKVSSLQFDPDGTITIGWHIDEESDEQGGIFYQSFITPEGQVGNEELAYWVKELLQTADEVLAEWRRHRRKPSVQQRN